MYVPCWDTNQLPVLRPRHLKNYSSTQYSYMQIHLAPYSSIQLHKAPYSSIQQYVDSFSDIQFHTAICRICPPSQMLSYAPAATNCLNTLIQLSISDTAIYMQPLKTIFFPYLISPPHTHTLYIILSLLHLNLFKLSFHKILGLLGL